MKIIGPSLETTDRCLPNRCHTTGPSTFSDDQRQKRSFLLHTAFGIKDLTYALLADIDPQLGERYLIAEGCIAHAWEPVAEPASPSETADTDDADEFVFD